MTQKNLIDIIRDVRGAQEVMRYAMVRRRFCGYGNIGAVVILLIVMRRR